MSRKSEKRIETEDASSPLVHKPLASLTWDGPLKEVPSVIREEEPSGSCKKKNRMRLDVKREKSGRGGKVVTVVYGIAPLGRQRSESMLKRLKQRLGTGGTLQSDSMEIQGDWVEATMAFLEDEGFRAIHAGG